MKPRIDFSKPIQTRAGLPARLLCTDAGGHFPVVALVTHPDGAATAVQFTSDGYCYSAAEINGRDLINGPEQRKVRFWVVINPTGTSILYLLPSPEYLKHCLACREVILTITDGEGLPQ